MKRVFTLFITLLLVVASANAQLKGRVVDALNGDSIPFATVSYKGHHVVAKADANGYFKIEQHNGWKLTFSSVGYHSHNETVADGDQLADYLIQLTPSNQQLSEVVVKAKRTKYQRKGNPAVELMRRVIAAKKKTDLKNKDFYSYSRYNKMKLAVNDIGEKTLNSKAVKNNPWFANQMEECDINGKVIMPLLVQEKVTKELWRKDPKKEQTVILGEKASGLQEIFQTGDIANIMMSDVFSSIDVYDNQIRLFRNHFSSPIGNDAIGFYRYYIIDTLKIDNDSCIHLHFLPNNQQDMGFRGELYVVNDSSLHVKRVKLGLPRNNGVNWVDQMEIVQEFQRVGRTGEDWVMSANDMFIELSIVGDIGQFAVINTNRFYDYNFAFLDESEFVGKARERYAQAAQNQTDDFWNRYRGTAVLTSGEKNTGSFLDGLSNVRGFKPIVWVLKAFVENYIETSPTGKPSYFDIGPVNTIVSHNDIDGWRFRLGGETTANLNRHLFFKGYVARGIDSKNTYYDAALIYSFPEKKYLSNEYPRRNIEIESSYDITSPADKFTGYDKDNVFTSLKWGKEEYMMYYNRQKVSYIHEIENGVKFETSLKTEHNEATGNLFFHHLSDKPRPEENGELRTTELAVSLQWSPGAKFFNTKQRQFSVNKEAPVYTITHTIGLKGIFGADYNYHETELSVFRRFYFNSWGKVTCNLKGGIQWSKVPFPLLLAPAANISYIRNSQAFDMMNCSEFMNDRYLSLNVAWEMDGKLFNRIPLLKKLKWREYIGFKSLWGGLSDKNNPTLPENMTDGRLMYFPYNSYIMNTKEPYMECCVGIQNILRMFSVYYVRRINYLNNVDAPKDGFRMGFQLAF